MRLSSPHPRLTLSRGCVVSYCPIASAVGSRVLQSGGNSIDAAVATALALAVTYPQAGNLGGGGFLLAFRPDGEVHFLDYRETSPAGVRPEMYDNDEPRSLVGALAVGVPGTVAGLAEALARFGTWSWDRLVGLAIDLAERGVWLTNRQALYLALHEASLQHFPSTVRALLADGRAPLPGTLFIQPDLARTLRALADEGPAAFYRGRVGALLVDEIARGGGVLDADDLAAYRPRWRTPLRFRFAGRDVYGAPLPSGGGLVTKISLELLEQRGALDATAPQSVERLEAYGRAFRLAYALRQEIVGDPDVLPDDVLERARRYSEEPVDAAELARFEATLEAPATVGVDAIGARANTTHFCVIDAEGGAVSNTYSLNTMFGAKLVVDGAGFLLNSSIDDFRISRTRPNWYDLMQGDHNHVGPSRRPVSSMSPAIACRDGKVEAIVGGSGGPRIPTLAAQVLVGVLHDRLRLHEVMSAPRVHHQYLPAELAVEQRLAADKIEALRARGHRVAVLEALGIGAAIRRDLATDDLSATLDGRFSFD